MVIVALVGGEIDFPEELLLMMLEFPDHFASVSLGSALVLKMSIFGGERSVKIILGRRNILPIRKALKINSFRDKHSTS